MSAFRKVFQGIVGMSPSACRDHFRIRRRAQGEGRRRGAWLTGWYRPIASMPVCRAGSSTTGMLGVRMLIPIPTGDRMMRSACTFFVLAASQCVPAFASDAGESPRSRRRRRSSMACSTSAPSTWPDPHGRGLRCHRVPGCTGQGDPHAGARGRTSPPARAHLESRLTRADRARRCCSARPRCRPAAGTHRPAPGSSGT